MKTQPIILGQRQVAIFDYYTRVIHFEDIPSHMETSEEIEEFLEERGYDVNNVHYMA